MKKFRKKGWILVILLVVFNVIFLSLLSIEGDFEKHEENEIRYAMSVDGKTVSNFPTKGAYQVDVTCLNATCTWSYDEWKLLIDNVTGNVSCDIDFTTISKKYINDYVTSMSDKTQGNGKIVNEVVNIPNYSTASAISQSSYNNLSFSNSQKTDTSNVFSYNNGLWSTDTTAMTETTYYYFLFYPLESGYYQMCYELSSGNIRNRLYAYVDETRIYFNGSTYLSASSSASQTGCVELGYVSSSSYIGVTQYTYTDISSLSFSIKKAGYIVESSSVRYEGKNPNNYVMFNNELWRIIGVFDEFSHGLNNQKLVKLIKDESIGNLRWETSQTNNWTTSSLNLLLNNYYLYAKDGTGSSYCSNLVCNYTITGIQDDYRKMISEVNWYLGGYSKLTLTAEGFYKYERGEEVYTGNPTVTTGYIGLLYPSDYGYSVLSTSCERTTSLYNYRSEKCSAQSWLFAYGDSMTITSSSERNDCVLGNNNYGVFSNFAVNGYFYVRPTLYLDSSVYVIDGDGSITDPYIIGM